jgi:hypothetical protein
MENDGSLWVHPIPDTATRLYSYDRLGIEMTSSCHKNSFMVKWQHQDDTGTAGRSGPSRQDPCGE